MASGDLLNPTRIHFTSPSGEDVGTIFADQVVHGRTGYLFLFGRLCAATLDGRFLTIGPRRIECSCLSHTKPFWPEERTEDGC